MSDLNFSTIIPPGWREDSKRFEINNVDASGITTPITNLVSGKQYIMKETRFYFTNTIGANAYFQMRDTSGGTVFGEGYYNDGSFIIFDGKQNGIINNTLTSAPYLTLNAGSGGISQTVFGTNRYYFK